MTTAAELSLEEKLERTQKAAMLALEFLQDNPPRIVLARGALKAALDPESPRWGD